MQDSDVRCIYAYEQQINNRIMNTKLLRKTGIMAAALCAMLFVQSCNDDDDTDYSLLYPNSLVTMKTDSQDGSLYLQLDKNTKVIPTNIKKSPYGDKELRALANIKFSDTDDKQPVREAFVNWLDTIRTKPMAADLGVEKNISTYGNDPMEIVNDWTTVVEDGYLTLRFRTYAGSGRRHELNLVKTDNPYEVMIYHNANGENWGQIRDGFIAFRLSDLPDTENKEVDLTVKWKSYNGEKSTKFKYTTRQ